MPFGLVVMRWDERIGAELLVRYPEEIIISDKTLMQVYSTHEYSGESGMISLMIGSLNIASYYTGPEKGYYILLLLSLEDDPDSYEGGILDISRVILQNLVEEAYLPLIPSLFQRLSVYPTLKNEQRCAITYQDEIKRMIIKRLRDEGVVAKSELMVWLKDQYKKGFVDLEGVLIEMVKLDIVKETTVKGMPSELIFLTRDILIFRLPPMNILNNSSNSGLPSQFKEKYKIELKKFFQNYKPNETDNLRIIDILINPEIYEILQLLRTAIVSREHLEKLWTSELDELDAILKMLWDNKLIHVFRENQNIEYYALLSDFYLSFIFPKYILNIIKKAYDQKSMSEQVLIEYLTVLENTYLNIKSTPKSEE